MDEIKENTEPTSNFVGSVTPNRGHIVYQLDTETGEVTEAHVEGRVIELPNGRTEIRKQIFIRDKFLYVSALNKKNAVKRFARMAKMMDQHKTNNNEATRKDDEDQA
jgi:hypothetical protein